MLDIEGNALFEEVQVVYQALGLHLIIVEGAAHQVAPPAGVSLWHQGAGGAHMIVHRQSLTSSTLGAGGR